MSRLEDLTTLVDMAAGRVPVDLLITNCKIVDVFTQSLCDGPLAIGMGRIIGIGNYETKSTLDAKGGYVMPGLIDGHVHIESSSLIPSQFARCILPHGTTTIIADPHEIANVCGLDGIRYMLNASQDLPLNVNIMLPSCVPATPYEESGAELLVDDLEILINKPGVHGLGEVMDYPGVIHNTKSVINKLKLAQRYNCVIDGHSPGVKGRELTAYVISGIMTDHECSSLEEMKDRLRLGIYILIREGSACKDLLSLVPGLTPANARRCVLCTDDKEPADILSTGHINKSLRLAVSAGVDPLMAISLATLNAAECYRLADKGAIAPGYDADLLIVDNLKEFTARHVLVNGKEIARNGNLLVELQDYISDTVLNTVRLAPIGIDALTLHLTSKRVRAIGVKTGGVLTESLTLTVVPDAKGCFDPKLNPGLNKLAVIERHHASGNIGLGILANYGLKNGAIATTVAHDSHNLVVVGDNDNDMLAAIEDIKIMGGGITLCREGRILAHLPLPVGGLMSEKSATEVAAQMEIILKIAKHVLSINADIQPIMTLAFMTLPVIPALKLTSTGLFDVTSFKRVDICLPE